VDSFLVGRQPVFDAEFEVQGYELLFRGPASPRPGGDSMTADVLVRAGLDIGLEGLVGKKLAFVNATRAFLVSDDAFPFAPGETVVEILEDVPRDTEVLEGCRRLVAAGYTLALDDYSWSDGPDPLMDLASIVKLDVLAQSTEQLATMLRRFGNANVKWLAEKVETHEQLRVCQDLGFDLYQGYVLSRPEVVKGNALSPSRLACLRIIERLCDPMTSARDIEKIVQTDAALSYRFLRAAGAGASRGLYRKISSVREGVVLLGERRLRSWVTLMLLSDGGRGSDEKLRIAMTRARMAELVAGAALPRLIDESFTVGLVSALDILLQAPLEQVLDSLSLADELRDALLEQRGPLGRILADVLAWEVGGGTMEPSSGLDLASVEKAYIEALLWAQETCDVVNDI